MGKHCRVVWSATLDLEEIVPKCLQYWYIDFQRSSLQTRDCQAAVKKSQPRRYGGGVSCTRYAICTSLLSSTWEQSHWHMGVWVSLGFQHYGCFSLMSTWPSSWPSPTYISIMTIIITVLSWRRNSKTSSWPHWMSALTEHELSAWMASLRGRTDCGRSFYFGPIPLHARVSAIHIEGLSSMTQYSSFVSSAHHRPSIMQPSASPCTRVSAIRWHEHHDLHRYPWVNFS